MIIRGLYILSLYQNVIIPNQFLKWSISSNKWNILSLCRDLLLQHLHSRYEICPHFGSLKYWQTNSNRKAEAVICRHSNCSFSLTLPHLWHHKWGNTWLFQTGPLHRHSSKELMIYNNCNNISNYLITNFDMFFISDV